MHHDVVKQVCNGSSGITPHSRQTGMTSVVDKKKKITLSYFV